MNGNDMFDTIQKGQCVICTKAVPHSGWLYVWKGKAGYACKECGERFHTIGDYLCKRACEHLKVQGIKTDSWKEKFGEWRLYTECNTDRERTLVKELEKQYSILFPEFQWSFY